MLYEEQVKLAAGILFGVVVGGIFLLAIAINLYRWLVARRERKLRDRMLQILECRPVDEVIDTLRKIRVINDFGAVNGIYDALRKFSPYTLGRAISSVVNEEVKANGGKSISAEILASNLAVEFVYYGKKGVRRVSAFVSGFKSRKHEAATSALDSALDKALEEKRRERSKQAEDHEINAALRVSGYKKPKVDLSGGDNDLAL